MIRTQYQKQEATIDGDIQVFGPTSIDWSSFQFNNGFKWHTLNAIEAERFYFVPIQYYGERDYEDILLFINLIPDITHLEAGQKIKIPTVEDITDFLKKYKLLT